ncbi:MAG: hypothetical protein ABID61_05745 [Candidatus Micrarchaeota archaeon]
MRAVFFLLLLPLVFSQSPPITEVEGHNLAMADFLENNFNSSVSETGSVSVSLGSYSQQFSLFTSIDIAGMSLVIENLTYPSESLSVLVARGYHIDHLVSLSGNESNIVCNSSYHPTSYCDFDGDGCPEFETNSSVVYQMYLTFSFRNISSTIPFSSTIVPVPKEILSEMSSSSGLDQLNISITGDTFVLYQINNQQFDSQCTDNILNISTTIPISTNRLFAVAGKNKLFFLSSPILSEQLASNNHFDVIVLSQSPLYYGEIDFDGNQSKNFTFKNFSIISGRYGIEEIISNKTEILNFAEYGPNLTTPTLLEKENHSFAYVYAFNSTYKAIGEHNLSLLVVDVFLGTEKHTETITSRMLSYGGIWAENGSIISPETTRPSMSPTQNNLNPVTISLGLVVLAVLLAFVNFWIKK